MPLSYRDGEGVGDPMLSDSGYNEDSRDSAHVGGLRASSDSERLGATPSARGEGGVSRKAAVTVLLSCAKKL